VQRRRVRDLAPVVGCWQTLARLVEGEEVARRAPGAAVLVEVETTGGPGRNGCPPGDVPGLVRSLRACDLDVRGLMVVAPAGPPAEARSAFRTTAALAAELGLGELSMGMSEDLEVAVEEGATMVRLGRALFGPRPAVDRAR
ncbi:MAG: alanine racemase, partial [Acidimicrobiales bacterium]